MGGVFPPGYPVAQVTKVEARRHRHVRGGRSAADRATRSRRARCCSCGSHAPADLVPAAAPQAAPRVATPPPRPRPRRPGTARRGPRPRCDRRRRRGAPTPRVHLPRRPERTNEAPSLFARRLLYWLSVAAGLVLAIVPAAGLARPRAPRSRAARDDLLDPDQPAHRGPRLRVARRACSSTCCAAWCSGSTPSASSSSRS